MSTSTPTHFRFAVLTACLLFATGGVGQMSVSGCRSRTDSTRDIQTYTAVVVKISESDAEHHFIDVGQQPVKYVYLQLHSSPNDSPVFVRLAFEGLVEIDGMGRVGDEVSFSYAGKLPFDGELPVRALDRYAIVKRAATVSR